MSKALAVLIILLAFVSCLAGGVTGKWPSYEVQKVLLLAMIFGTLEFRR